MDILYIQTGGSIDKDYPPDKDGIAYAFTIEQPAVKRVLKKVRPSYNFRIIELMKKDSLDITEADRQLIVDTCADAPEDKIIISHGTDTMVETAKALGHITNKTIVLTGAYRPERFRVSDASYNLGTASGIASIAPAGIYIAMNGRAFEWDKVGEDKLDQRFYDTSTDE